jgi:hypothetical protein
MLRQYMLKRVECRRAKGRLLMNNTNRITHAVILRSSLNTTCGLLSVGFHVYPRER